VPKAVNGLKQCSACLVIKPVAEFHVSRAEPDGLTYICKACTVIKKRKDIERNKARNAAADPGRFERMTKTCNGCGETKSGVDFYRDNSSADGLGSLCRECGKQKTRAYRLADPEKNHDLALRRTHNIDLERWRQYYAAQGGTCGVPGCPKTDCGVSPKTGMLQPLHVDHDHRCCPGQKSCGKCVRGLLCGEHNRVVGFLERSDIEAVKFYLANPINISDSAEERCA